MYFVNKKGTGTNFYASYSFLNIFMYFCTCMPAYIKT